MAKLMLLGELIDTAIAAENAARKVYLGFTHKFIDRPDVSDFWKTMADDEADHARILEDVRRCLCAGVGRRGEDEQVVYRSHRHLPAEVLTEPVDARLAESAEQLKTLDIHKLVQSVGNLDDAYLVAYNLESSEVNMIFNFLTIRFLPIEKNYDIISATIDRHLLRLAEFSRTFGGAEDCKQIAATA